LFFISLILVSWIPLLNHKRGTKTRVVRSGGRLEGWFSGDNELIEKYRFETSRKVINNPKGVSFGWLKSQKLDDVRRLLKEQLLKRFLEMKRNIYQDLIRVFYTNLKFEGNNLVSHVKGVDTEITHEVWAAMTGLKYARLRINKGNISVVEDFNKIQYYKSCLKIPHAQVRTCSVGGLKLNERLLALIVTWILTPKGSNHFVLTEEDLVYIYCIMSKHAKIYEVKINWIHIMKEHMQKSMRLSDYHYPYAILISKFLNYFEVNLEDETSDLVKSTHEVNNGSLSNMDFTKINGRWVSKDGEHGGSSSGVHVEHHEEDQEAAEGTDMNVQDEEQPVADLGVGTTVGHHGNRIPSMSSFESFMVNRLDIFAENQRNLHDLCVTNFQNFDNRFQSMDTRFQTLDELIEVVQNQLFELQYGKED